MALQQAAQDKEENRTGRRGAGNSNCMRSLKQTQLDQIALMAIGRTENGRTRKRGLLGRKYGQQAYEDLVNALKAAHFSMDRDTLRICVLRRSYTRLLRPFDRSGDDLSRRQEARVILHKVPPSPVQSHGNYTYRPLCGPAREDVTCLEPRMRQRTKSATSPALSLSPRAPPARSLSVTSPSPSQSPCYVPSPSPSAPAPALPTTSMPVSPLCYVPSPSPSPSPSAPAPTLPATSAPVAPLCYVSRPLPPLRRRPSPRPTRPSLPLSSSSPTLVPLLSPLSLLFSSGHPALPSPSASESLSVSGFPPPQSHSLPPLSLCLCRSPHSLRLRRPALKGPCIYGISYRFSRHELKGCNNDAKCMHNLLVSGFYFPESSIVIITSEVRYLLVFF